MEKKILWIHDAGLEDNPTGGAERTNQMMIRACPYDLYSVTPTSLTSKEQLNEFDLIIINNIKFFSHKQIEWMLACSNRIRYEHDYWNLVDPGHEQYKKEMWEGSLTSIFLSPAHRKEYIKQHPNISFNNTIMQSSPIETDLFYPPEEKENIVVYIGPTSEHKGFREAVKWATKNKVPLFVFGKLVGEEWLSNSIIRYGGELVYGDVAKILRKASVFVFFPVWVEPFGRLVCEARLSGCNLVVNNKIGCMSCVWWNSDDSFVRDYLKNQPNIFWEKIKELL